MGLIRMGPPENLIIKLASDYKIRDFVETGTYEAATSVWASEHFENVFTIEMSEHFYSQSRQKYNDIENIKFIFGDSRLELKKIIDGLESPAVFWLDAHWSGGATYGDNDQCPILKEIEIINSGHFDNFIFIDDARLFTSPPQPPHRPEQWSNIIDILRALQTNRRDKYIVIIEDVIIAVPTFAKSTLIEYCQDVNAKIWEQYSKRDDKSNYGKASELLRKMIPDSIIKLFKTAEHNSKTAKKDIVE